MRFDNPQCPQCNEPATHILERVYCHTPIAFDKATGEMEWQNDETTTVLWDTSEPLAEDEVNYTLHCRVCRKSWDAKDLDGIDDESEGEA